MNKIRLVLIIACVITIAGVLGCTKRDTKNMQTILDTISHAPESELPGVLYGYSQSSPGAQRVLLGMLRPLRTPSPDQHMSVKAVRHSGRFTMIVAQVPWPRGTEGPGLQPIIITGEAGREQVVGYVLPFNDIASLMQGGDMQSIAELSQWYLRTYAHPRGV